MEKNPHAQALGALGGKKRAITTTPEQRKAIGRLGGLKAKQNRDERNRPNALNTEG